MRDAEAIGCEVSAWFFMIAIRSRDGEVKYAGDLFVRKETSETKHKGQVLTDGDRAAISWKRHGVECRRRGVLEDNKGLGGGTTLCSRYRLRKSSEERKSNGVEELHSEFCFFEWMAIAAWEDVTAGFVFVYRALGTDQK
jgi:hypothetical protein